jgi:hypothetical protein
MRNRSIVPRPFALIATLIALQIPLNRFRFYETIVKLLNNLGLALQDGMIFEYLMRCFLFLLTIDILGFVYFSIDPRVIVGFFFVLTFDDFVILLQGV